MQMNYEYMFDIEFSFLNKDSIISFTPYQLVSFTKECNYFENYIPSYKLTCKIKDKHLNYLRIFDKDMTVKIKHIMRYGSNKDDLSESKILSELEFACYYDKDSIPNYTASAKVAKPELEEKDEYTKDILGPDIQHTLTFHLLLKKDIKMKTFIHNYIFGSEEKPATTIDAVMTIIEQNPYVTSVLIDNPSNVNEYTDIIVEPAELKDAIKNLQYKYGIYDKGLELFYDNGMLYVLNKLELYHVKRNKELNTVQIRLNEKTSVPNAIDYALINEEEGYIGYERKTSINKIDFESIEGIYSGDKFVYSNFGTVINSVFGDKGDVTMLSPTREINRPKAARLDVGVKKILDYDMLNNPFNMNSFVYEKTPGVTLVFAITSMNPEHFTPNKLIKLGFDTPESQKLYSGVYNIQSVTFVYEQTKANPNKRFSAFGHAILTLTNKHLGYDEVYTPTPPKN